MGTQYTHCHQHDPNSVIDEQKTLCRGDVWSIHVLYRNQFGQKAYEKDILVCATHLNSWNNRNLLGQGYEVGKPSVVGKIIETARVVEKEI